jgi:hypothetical protein
MAAFNFPNSPSVNDIHSENGVSFKWNGTVWNRFGPAYTDTANLNVTGIGTIAGNLNVGGVLTYEDVKNVDSIGIVTARAGVKVTGGDISVGTAGTISSAGNITLDKPGAGIITATKYYGDGSTLTNVTSTTINNNANNRVITGSGTANTLEAESTLTYDGSTLSITGSQNTYLNNNILKFDRAGYSYIDQVSNSGSLVFRVTASNTIALRLDSSAQAIFGSSLIIPDAIQHDGDLDTKIRFPAGNTISFETNSNERLRIASDGKVSIGTGTPRQLLHLNVGDSGAANIVFTNTGTGTSAGDG